MSVAIIGRGLFGAAAARHLAKAGCDVTLIGPDEPADKRSHRGVFAAHYDEGRITRKLALDPWWSAVSIAAIKRYGEIEAESGIGFYTEAGAMMAGGPDFMARVARARDTHAIACDMLDSDALTARFPFFAFSPDVTATYEPTEAGHVSPRRLVQAQTKAAQTFGARVLTETVQGFDMRPDHVRLSTDQGAHQFDYVLLAAGSMSEHLLSRPARHTSYARTVALFEVSEAEAQRLKSMPSLVYEAPEDPYLLPPIRYPNGRIYLKLGGDPVDAPLDTAADLADWFRAGGSAVVRDRLEQMIRDLMPDLAITAVTMDACSTTWTADRYPEIAWLDDRLAICGPGNGAGAKCSDEIGRLGAALIQEKTGAAA